MLEINRGAVRQYLLLYIMVCWFDTFVYNRVLSGFCTLVAFGLLILFIFHKKYRDDTVVLLCCGLLVLIILLRYAIGGIGISLWTGWVSCILITLLAIKSDSSRFVERYIKLIVFLATVSLVFYGISVCMPSVFNMLPFSRYESGWTYQVWNSATTYTSHEWYNKGLWLYVNRENQHRNIGIFTEPGLYQMHLNTAIVMLLFFRRNIRTISDRVIRRYLVILCVTLLTTQSTTGYIALLIIVIFFFLQRETGERKIKNAILMLLCLVIIGILIDYSVRLESSLLYTTVIDKIFNQSLTLSGANSIENISSGAYRIESILRSIQLIIENPFGRGYAAVEQALGNTTVAGAVIFVDMASAGVLPVLLLLVFIMKPIMQSSLDTKMKILLVFLYFNTVLAQSSEVYPALICIPMCLRYGIIEKKMSANALIGDIIDDLS